MRKNNVILIGFMGAGKTSVGKCLAGKTGKCLLDTDKLIEQDAGMRIPEIFTTQGEAAFRRTETAVLKRLLRETRDAVISVGGGLPLLPENREILKKLGTVIFLRETRETALSRLKGDTTRPMLQGGDVKKRVDELLAYRNPLYTEAAHAVVDVDGKTLERIADEVIEIWAKPENCG